MNSVVALQTLSPIVPKLLMVHTRSSLNKGSELAHRLLTKRQRLRPCLRSGSHLDSNTCWLLRTPHMCTQGCSDTRLLGLQQRPETRQPTPASDKASETVSLSAIMYRFEDNGSTPLLKQQDESTAAEYSKDSKQAQHNNQTRNLQLCQIYWLRLLVLALSQCGHQRGARGWSFHYRWKTCL
jgi:hypothetical protein